MCDFIAFAYFLRRASKSIRLIATSSGSDITNLMRGMAALVSLFRRITIVVVLMIIEGFCATTGRLSQLAALRRSGESVQVSSSSFLFGVFPPAWLVWIVPLFYSLITVFMVVDGAKSLHNEIDKITAGDAGVIAP